MIDETLMEEYLKRIWDSNMDKFLNKEDENLENKRRFKI